MRKSVSLMQSFFVAACAVIVSGCGYTLSGGGSVLPQDVKKIYIPFVENDSTEPGLSNTLTEALRDQFDRFGAVMVVENSKDADATLRVRVLRVNRDTRSTSGRDDIATQYDSTLVLAADLRRNNGQVLWRTNNLQVNRSFGATGGAVVASSADFASGVFTSSSSGLGSRELARGQEQEALEALAQQAARRIYNDAVAPDF